MGVEKIIESLPNMTAQNRDKLRLNAEKIRDSGNKKQIEDAEAVLQSLIDTAAAEKQARFDELTAMTMAERVQDVFITSPANKTEARAIGVLIDNPGETASRLTAICGWKTQTWQAYFGAMCKRREAVLWPDSQTDSMTPGKLIGLLVDEDEATHALTMKPDVAETFLKMGFGTKRRRSRAVSAAA